MNMRQSLTEFGLLVGEATEAVWRTVALTLTRDSARPCLNQLYHPINGHGHGPTNGHHHAKRRSARPLRLLFLQGWFSPIEAIVYQGLIEALTSGGVEVVANPLTWRQYHFSDIRQNGKILARFVDDQEIDLSVGHSLGGIAAAFTSTLSRRPLPFVTIATPINGTPIDLLHQLVSRSVRLSIPDSRRRLRTIRDKVKRRYNQVPHETISGNEDIIAPRQACELGGAHHALPGNHIRILENPDVAKIILEFAHSCGRLRQAAA
jgi:hypothetical protein